MALCYLSKGANPNMPGEFSLPEGSPHFICSPLVLSILDMNLEVVDLLIEYKANINGVQSTSIKEEEGLGAVIKKETALHVAVDVTPCKEKTAITTVIQKLLDSGARLAMLNSDGLTPLGLARKLNRTSALEVFEKVVSTARTPQLGAWCGSALKAMNDSAEADNYCFFEPDLAIALTGAG